MKEAAKPHPEQPASRRRKDYVTAAVTGLACLAAGGLMVGMTQVLHQEKAPLFATVTFYSFQATIGLTWLTIAVLAFRGQLNRDEENQAPNTEPKENAG